MVRTARFPQPETAAWSDSSTAAGEAVQRRDDTSRQQLTLVHRIAALLLDRPDEDLRTRLPSLRSAAAGLPDPVHALLEHTLDHLARTTTAELMAGYVVAVDTARHRDHPRRIAVRPPVVDHLCAVLDHAASADPAAGTRLLVEHRVELEELRLALAAAGSPYAAAVTAVTATLP